MKDGTRLAAIDLGSNSFRLEVGCISHGHYGRTGYWKETIRQGSALDSAHNLSAQALQSGWDCLARFSARLAGFEATEVKAVATQTLREAKNRDEFLTKATQILGFPIALISGLEEARLIYQGVAHSLPQDLERRLVLDIGGRSTELMLGQAFTPSLLASYPVGSMAWSGRYFPDNQFSQAAFDLAEGAAKDVLGDALKRCPREAWDVAYGSAGTVGAVGDVLLAAGWPAGCINRAGLDWLKQQLIQAQSGDRIQLAGMKEDRRPVIGGGLSVMSAVFDLLQIEAMHMTTGGLRHGLVLDLIMAGAGNARPASNAPLLHPLN